MDFLYGSDFVGSDVISVGVGVYVAVGDGVNVGVLFDCVEVIVGVAVGCAVAFGWVACGLVVAVCSGVLVGTFGTHSF